ncbi:DNA topoisomerase IV [Flavobacteriaceae bacterium KMM 6897]|nr:DNA topoisomerase IV [Flavobacteriaceae bacterium KMM 6897]
MIKNSIFLIFSMFLCVSCYQPERNCNEFKEGEFSFTSMVNGEEMTTTFIRKNEIEIDFFQGKSDTSTVRWINDCEYIVKKINPKNMAEEKSVHMKIMSTTDDTYTFEYNIVGDNKKSRGTATKTK